MSSYGTRAEADTYHTARGNTTWTGTDGAKDIALLRASEYIDATFRTSFAGLKYGDRSEQVREWPRSEAVDINGDYIDHTSVPLEVEYATYEAALRELVSPGSLQPDYDPASQVKREKVDVIEVEYTASHGPGSVLPVINIVRGILAPVLTGGGVTRLSGRAVRV